MIICGDCREILPTLPAQSVQCCVTSPPYWGLRDYGTAQWDGGDAGCDHKPPTKNRNGRDRSGLTGSLDYVECQEPMYKGICHCGARRIDSQLGLEATPEEYITKMVAVFREVWRVLRDDGTLWVNMGDSYTGGNNTRSGNNPSSKSTLTTNNGRGPKDGDKYNSDNFGRSINRVTGLKPKDLCGIPWRLAFALQADGWYLRSDIIWHKPNPMPESVTDRPTKAHEYIFLLTKAERYFYDAEAIREPQVDPERTGKLEWGKVGDRNGMTHYANRENIREYHPNGRNKRTVWTIPTQPYVEAHFATFPEEIPKLCILAGSKPGDTILDPFAGSGTVGKVALELGRKAVLIELSQEYVQLIKWRTFITPGFF